MGVKETTFPNGKVYRAEKLPYKREYSRLLARLSEGSMALFASFEVFYELAEAAMLKAGHSEAEVAEAVESLSMDVEGIAFLAGALGLKV